jgi:hypothetical protein
MNDEAILERRLGAAQFQYDRVRHGRDLAMALQFS